MMVRSYKDRLTGRRQYYHDTNLATGEFSRNMGGKTYTVPVRWKDGKIIMLHPSRISRKLFQQLNPGVEQPECGSLSEI